ncbi:uncharacterized protein TNCV_224071 [Trichonephila clavipes]|nr:uncharacterized protein TNCV_224071 [Trichonephila clavipes]
MFLAGHPSQGCFGLQSHCAPCYFFNQASFYPSDFSFNEAPKPRLPDSIDHPITVMPPSRMQNTTLAMPLVEDLSRYGIEDCSYSPEAQKSNAYTCLQIILFVFRMR